MTDLEFIYQRIRTANKESRIAVERVNRGNHFELRSYFAGCSPAPSYAIAKNHESSKIRGDEVSKKHGTKGLGNKILMMPYRDPQEQLGEFFGLHGVEQLKIKMREFDSTE